MSLFRERSRSPCDREIDDDEHWLSDIFEVDECVDIPASAIDTDAHPTYGPIASATELVIADASAPVEFVAVPTTLPIVGWLKFAHGVEFQRSMIMSITIGGFYCLKSSTGIRTLGIYRSSSVLMYRYCDLLW